MKTKNIRLKKMASLCCLLIFFIFNGSLCAQVVYTNIIDATPNATYRLDLNNDSIVDFTIQFDMLDKVMCKPENNNAYSGEVVSAEHLPYALSASTSICDTPMTWYDTSNPGSMAWGTSIGHWAGATDKLSRWLRRSNVCFIIPKLRVLLSTEPPLLPNPRSGLAAFVHGCLLLQFQFVEG